jgi:thiamine-phosphate pyrophosphorylase
MSAQLYLITPPNPGAGFADTLAALLDMGGIACVRLQVEGGEAAIRTLADTLRPVCVDRDVPLVMTDHIRLVAAHGLQGVHLTDAGAQAVRAARQALGRDAIVGAFGGTTRHKAMLLAEAGADYVSLGPVRAGALGDGREADAGLFAWWDAMIETPSVGEGGLQPADATLRADFLAPRLSVWDHPEGPAEGLRAWQRAVREADETQPVDSP